jgi:predicted site-specific integrase-resolvase
MPKNSSGSQKYPDGLVDRATVCEHFDISLRTLTTWVKTKKIPVVRVSSRMLRFRLADCQRAIERLTIKEAK